MKATVHVKTELTLNVANNHDEYYAVINKLGFVSAVYRYRCDAFAALKEGLHGGESPEVYVATVTLADFASIHKVVSAPAFVTTIS